MIPNRNSNLVEKPNVVEEKQEEGGGENNIKLTPSHNPSR